MILVKRCFGLGLLLAVSGCSEGTEPGNPSEDQDVEGKSATGGSEPATGGGDSVGSGGVAATGGIDGSGGESEVGTGGEASTATGGDTAASGGADGTGGETSGDPACEAARYCEDFESYEEGSVPGAPWSVTTIGAATLAADSSRPYIGNRALHVVMKQSSERDNAYLEQSNSAAVPVPGGNLFGRMMMYRTPGPSPEHHFWLLDASGGGTNLRLGGLTPGNGSDIRYYLGHEPSHSAPRSGADTAWDLEQGQWTCLEWQFDTNENETRVWLDGEAIDALTQTGWEIGNIDTLRLGQIMNWAPAADQEIWFDQFAIDEKRIPCPDAP